MKEYRGNKAQFDIGLVIGVPHRKLIHAHWFYHIDKMRQYMPAGIEWTFVYSIGREIGDARQRIAEKALEKNAKYLMFIDDDVFIPYDAVMRMMSHGKDIVSGVYWTKSKPPCPVITEQIGGGPWYDFPTDALAQIGGSGLGCCLIKTDVFRKLKEKGENVWFKTDWLLPKKDGTVSKVDVGEDHFFFWLCNKHGIEAWADTSVLCDHIDQNTEIIYPGKEYIDKFIEERAPKEVKERLADLENQVNKGELSVRVDKDEVEQ